MNIKNFLLARIAEDEKIAAAAVGDGRRWWVDGPTRETGLWWVVGAFIKFPEKAAALHIARHDPARVLAECAAKRRTVDLYERHRENRDARRSPAAREAEDARAAQDRSTQEARTRVAEEAVLALASVYSDHPDFDPAWALPE